MFFNTFIRAITEFPDDQARWDAKTLLQLDASKCLFVGEKKNTIRALSHSERMKFLNFFLIREKHLKHSTLDMKRKAFKFLFFTDKLTTIK